MPKQLVSPRQKKYRQIGRKTRAFVKLILLILEIVRRILDFFS